MAERRIHAPTYVIIWAVLVLLTCLTVAASLTGLAGRAHVLVGLFIAVCKGTLVVLFFMHLLYSPRLTWLVVIVSCFWLSLLIGLTLTDYLGRDLVEYMPGH